VNFEVLIPVLNEKKILEFSIEWFKKNNIPVRYVFDTKGDKDVLKILESNSQKYSTYKNEKYYWENSAEEFCSSSNTNWNIVVSIDEIIDIDVVNFCDNYLSSKENKTIAFDRKQLDYDGHKIYECVSELFSPRKHAQLRFFDRTAVKWNKKIHSPGFEIEQYFHAPDNLNIYHLDFIFCDAQERLTKSARYDSYGQINQNREQYEIDKKKLKWIEIENSTFEKKLTTLLKMVK
jgi:hypothetical protein